MKSMICREGEASVGCSVTTGGLELSDRVMRRVLTAPDEELAGYSVCVLASTFKMDRFKLARKFKSQTNMTLEQFLFREKMDRASYLLKACKLPIREIAERIGFCTSGYFIRKFKEYYGIVPGQYRELKWSFGNLPEPELAHNFSD